MKPIMTRLQQIQTSLVMTAVTGIYVAVVAGMRVSENILAISTTICGIGMFVGSVVALKKRTWGVGLVFAAAVAFATAAAMKMGPWTFWIFALGGAMPMALGAKPFARFDRKATLLFARIAMALGVGSALVWHEIWPSVWQLANCR